MTGCGCPPRLTLLQACKSAIVGDERPKLHFGPMEQFPGGSGHRVTGIRAVHVLPAVLDAEVVLLQQARRFVAIRTCPALYGRDQSRVDLRPNGAPNRRVRQRVIRRPDRAELAIDIVS
jgi:hypothetical protein